MQCFVYRSERKPNSFLMLPVKDDFSALSNEFLKLFGEPGFSFEFELTPERKMAQADAQEVLKNFSDNGFHLQLSNEDKDPFDALVAEGKL